MTPYIKMVSTDFVGLVPVEQIVEGDVLAEGVVIDVDRDGGDYLVALAGGSFNVYAKGAKLMRIARLTKYAWEGIVQPYLGTK